MFASASTKSRRRWKKWFFGLTVGLVAVFAVVFLADSWAKPAPTYNGIALNRWIEISSGSREISQGLVEIGPQAIPYLIRAIERKDSALLVLEEKLNDESGVIRGLTAFAIGKIRGPPESAVPTLVRELENEERESIQISWEFHVTESQNIAGFALSPRQTAPWFLGEMGPAAKEAVPALMRILQSPRGSLGNEWRRILVVRAIWRIGQQVAPVLPTLRNALNSKDEFQCVMAARILGEMGPSAKSMVPALLEARKVSMAIRREVNDALKKIDPEALREPNQR